MSGVWLLSFRHLMHARMQAIILIACLAVVVFLPLASQRLITRYSERLGARADATPMLLGSLGNRFDLTLQSLYFRAGDSEPVPWSAYTQLLTQRDGIAIPMHVRYTARNDIPIVATTIEYFEVRNINVTSGHLPRGIGEVVIGSAVAKSTGLRVDDSIFSDQKEIYDISKAPALKMHIVGILAETGAADDHAVFVDINTAWVLEGYVHGHDDPEEVTDPALLYGRTDERIVFSEALMQYNEITPANAHLFHMHGDKSNLPLTSILFFPRDAKAATLTKARINADGAYQMVVPRTVIDDLMAVVFRIKTIFDALIIVMAVSTALLTALVMLLSLRLRRGEIATLHRIGCSRFMVVQLCGTELLFIVVVSLIIAVACILITDIVLPDLIQVI